MAEHDEAMDRLRTSDPATGSHPDLHALRALVAQKAPASQGSDEVTRLRDDPLRGPRTTAPWIVAAAVAAIGLGGGYALGAHQAEPPVVAGGTSTDPASSGDDAAPGDDRASDDANNAGGMDGDVGGDEAMTMSEDMAMDGDMSMGGGDAAEYRESGMAYDLGPVRLTAGEGLPTGPGTGEVQALRYDEDPEELVNRLAAGLGMNARPLPEEEGWFSSGHGVVDPTTGQVIQAYADSGALTFSYESVFASEWCASMFEGYSEEDLVVVREHWTRSYGPDMPLPDADSCQPLEGPAPSDDEARAAAEEFLALLEVDLSDYTVETYGAEMYGDWEQPTVNIEYYRQDSHLYQVSFSVIIGPGGVVTNVHGGLGDMTSLGEYPVISAAEAVERYGERTWGLDWQVSIPEDYEPWPGMEDELSMPAYEDYEMPEPVTLSPGDPIPLLLKDKTVTSAELVQGTLWTQNGGVLEVPAWKLVTADGMYYSVLALADEALDFQSWE